MCDFKVCKLGQIFLEAWTNFLKALKWFLDRDTIERVQWDIQVYRRRVPLLRQVSETEELVQLESRGHHSKQAGFYRGSVADFTACPLYTSVSKL